MEHLKTFQELNEDTSATGGPAVSGGMGAVVSAQPSGLAGQTIGQNWASNGGIDGSGDIGVPYNPSGSNRVFQKLPMGKGHGAMTGKKSREKKLDLKALKMSFDKRKKNDIESGVSKPKKVMNFDDFSVRKDITSVKRLSESVKLVSEEEELSPLEKEFGIKLNSKKFLSESEKNFDIYDDNDDKIGFLIISEDVYDDYEFKQEYGEVVYLSYIRLSEPGHLREVIDELKNIYKDKDGIILQIEASEFEKYKTLKSKYESVGFIGIIPDTVAEFYIDIDDNLDIYDDPVFMILKIK
jgi:hypothetical protein